MKNRREALTLALRALADNDLNKGRGILQTHFLSGINAAPNDPETIFKQKEVYEANSFRQEPWLEYVAVLLLSVADGLEKRASRLFEELQNVIDNAFRVALKENCHADLLAEMAAHRAKSRRL